MDERGFITTEDVRQALRLLYRSDGEINLKLALLRIASDDMRPVNGKGHMRPSTVLVVLGGLLFLLAAVFLYFSLGARG